MGSPRNMSDEQPPRPRPARTPEEQENRLISLAVAQAEEMLEEGRAPTQVLTHYLKLASSREQKEQKRLELENELLQAKRQQISMQTNSEELYAAALEAFRGYAGDSEQGDPFED